MKLSLIKEKLSADEVITFDIMPNPSNLTEWVVWVREPSGESYLLLNNDCSFVGSKDVNTILSLLKSLGVKNAHISL